MNLDFTVSKKPLIYTIEGFFYATYFTRAVVMLALYTDPHGTATLSGLRFCKVRVRLSRS